jgi:hypothetical protein
MGCPTLTEASSGRVIETRQTSIAPVCRETQRTCADAAVNPPLREVSGAAISMSRYAPTLRPNVPS